MLHKRLALASIQALYEQNRKIDEDIEDMEQRARDYKYSRMNFKMKLEQRARDALNMGVCIVDRYDDNECTNMLNKSMYNVLKDIMQEIERPFIVSTEHEGRPTDDAAYQIYRRVRIPRNSKLKNVAAGLLLASDNHAEGEKRVVVHEVHERTWQFVFVGQKGKQLYEHWLEQCKTDPVFRVCMGLPHVSTG